SRARDHLRDLLCVARAARVHRVAGLPVHRQPRVQSRSRAGERLRAAAACGDVGKVPARKPYTMYVFPRSRVENKRVQNPKPYICTVGRTGAAYFPSTSRIIMIPAKTALPKPTTATSCPVVRPPVAVAALGVKASESGGIAASAAASSLGS